MLVDVHLHTDYYEGGVSSQAGAAPQQCGWSSRQTDREPYLQVSLPASVDVHD